MNERALYRIGAIGACLGAVLAAIGNALHPRPEDATSVESILRMVADCRVWVGVQVGLFIAVLLVVGGLVALYRSISGGAGQAWARLGATAAIAGAAVYTVLAAVSSFVLKGAADGWAGAPGAEAGMAYRVAEMAARLNFALFSVWTALFFGVAFLLYGLAIVTSATYPKWLGWVAVVVGAVSAWVGIHQIYRGPSFAVTTVLFTICAVVFTVWIFVMGVLLWRKAGAR